MEERIEKLERETIRLRHQTMALQAALGAIVDAVPQCHEALQTLLDTLSNIAPFQQIPDQELDAFRMYLSRLLKRE